MSAPESDSTTPESEDPPAVEAVRPRVADDRVARPGLDAEELEESDVADDAPVDPPEPVVSASATGIAANPEPTPSATAKAPTRPM